MQRLAWIAATLLGISTAYAEQPGRPVYPEPFDRRGNESIGKQANWVPLAERYTANTDRQDIEVGGQIGRFRLLRLQAVRGRPVIHRLDVEFLDRTHRQYNIESALDQGGIVVRLHGGQRGIRRITVFTEPSHHAAYEIFGR